MSIPDSDTCYRAVAGRDARFDGWFFTAVKTTGIYCRPSCPALTPKRANVRFYPSAAAAQGGGFRACKRCRPDASPGSPDWDVRGDLAGRALRLIGDGVIDREGVAGLARTLGYSERQLNRVLVAEVGAAPLALARAQRAQTARILLETSQLPSGDIAFAAGFSSIRQFNDTIREVFATTPTGLRTSRFAARVRTAGSLRLRLPFRAPMSLDRTLAYLGDRAIAGVESCADGRYARTIQLPGGPALITVSDGGGHVDCELRLTDQRDLVAAVARTRRMLDLDADPVAVDEALDTDPALAPLVGARPGLRSPGTVDGFELLVRAIVGQQVSVSGARTVLGRIVADHGSTAFEGEPWRLFPTALQLAAADDLPLPRARAATIRRVSEAVGAGELILDPGAHRDAVRRELLTIAGIGPWTADYVAMRALADPDVLMTGDLGVRRSAAALDVDLGARTARWAPWRSYATHHLWAAASVRAEPGSTAGATVRSTIQKRTS